MTASELLVLKTEESRTRQILEIIRESQDIKEAEEKVKALLDR